MSDRRSDHSDHPRVWRRVDAEWPDRPYHNLAYEESIGIAVADGAVRPTLRFWRNDRTIVVGRHQCTDLEVNYDACVAREVRVVRRFSGGGAVYHDRGNLNYTIVVPQSGGDFRERHRGFEIAADAVTAGLRRLGVDARFQPINDISVGDQKISGLAGTLTRNALIYHGCLLVSSDLSILAEVLNVAKEKLESKAVRSVRKRVTTLEELAGEPVSMDAVKDAIAAGVAETFDVRIEPDEPTAVELEHTERLLREKYLTDDWQFGPCRKCPCRATPERELLSRVAAKG